MKTRETLSIWIIGFIIGLLFIPNSVLSQKGTFIYEIVYSPALEGNLLGDNPNRDIFVYLPPNYNDNSDRKYPVVYLLHGYTWAPFGFVRRFHLRATCDSLISNNIVKPMIIVLPDAKNKYRGSYYTNSYITGNWEDFITIDLIEYIDTNYRTIKSAQGRGIAGHSMGGYGAIKIAMKHPELFSAVYGLSPAVLDFEDSDRGTMNSFLEQAATESQFNGLKWQVQTMIAQAAAFTPDSSYTPFMCRFPLKSNGDLIEPVWQVWLRHDPISMVDKHKENLMKLKNIKFDCGTVDEYLLTGNQNFSRKLTTENISHTYVEYEGDHLNKIKTRISDHLLPFFSNSFAEK
ncbi:esterase [candidate division KSB1 bacterium]|nr:esterase [candidate division KSB1 bacterium]